MKNIKYWFIRMSYRLKGKLEYDKDYKQVNPGDIIFWYKETFKRDIVELISLGRGYYIRETHIIL